MMPAARGRLTPDRPLADLTWLRAGGPADWLFQPADEDDLAAFLKDLDPDVPVFPMGVGSNLIVRDGGIPGVVIRLGRGFNGTRIEGGAVIAGAAALDMRVATAAADAGRDLTFLRTIPGTAGGAVAMNAGCYGTYAADRVREVRAVLRGGTIATIPNADLGFAYRSSALPRGCVVTEVTFDAPGGDPETLHARMKDQLARRDESQPTKDRTAGSTFRNPAGYSSTGEAGDPMDLKAWKLIDEAGLRGHALGGARMSPKHPNFLENFDGATATELEALGEHVRKRVADTSGHLLEWEVIRIGRQARPD
ncbi:MAG: UDP-N-acetylmuramate dehydrogenase [Hasllibacter sp.]